MSRRARLAPAVLAVLVLAALACGRSARLPAWDASPPPIATGPIGAAERVHRSELSNGLSLLVLEDRALPRLEVGLVLRRGAASEPVERAGALSLLADVMQRGAGERDALALAEAVESLGASLSVDAGWDSLSVGLSGLSEDAEQLFALLADVALRPRLERAEVERARGERLAAIERGRDQPPVLLGRQLARTLYPGHRYGLPLAGDEDSVVRLDPALLRETHAARFGARQAILYAVGDVSPQGARALVREHFGDWEPGTGVALGPPPPERTPSERRVVVVDRPELGQAQVAVAHEGVARADPDRIAIGLVNTVLGGGGFLSRLMTSVRADEGLVYSIGSRFQMRRQAGPFSVQTATRVEEVGRVVDLVLAQMARLRDEPLTEDELRFAKSFRTGRFVLGLETSASIAGSLVELDVQALPPDSLDTFRDRLAALTRDEVSAAARRVLHPERTAIVVVGPARELATSLARFGDVEIVDP